MIEIGNRPIRIDTGRLILRPLREEDVSETYVNGLNDPLVNEYLVTVKAMRQTLAGVKAFVAHNAADPHGILFGVFPKVTSELIGTVRLHGIEPLHRTATLGVCIFVRAEWAKGYSREALAAISDWAFAHLPVRYLEASCYAENRASLMTFLKAGFDVAARIDDKYLHNGRPAPVLYLKRLVAEDDTREG